MLVSLLVRVLVAIHRLENRLMATVQDLQAAIDALIADQAKFITDVQAQIAALQALSPAPEDFQPLVDQLNAAKAAVDAADAATAPPVVTPPAPAP